MIKTLAYQRKHIKILHRKYKRHKQNGRENENMAKIEKEKKGETEYQESVTGLD